MKAVDITLIFQAFHFFIAYWMLRSYVFYPALDVLAKQESDEEKLESDIAQALEKKQQAEAKKKQRWIAIKERLHSLVPSLVAPVFKLSHIEEKKELEHASLLSDSQYKKVKKTMYDALSDVKK